MRIAIALLFMLIITLSADTVVLSKEISQRYGKWKVTVDQDAQKVKVATGDKIDEFTVTYSQDDDCSVVGMISVTFHVKELKKFFKGEQHLNCKILSENDFGIKDLPAYLNVQNEFAFWGCALSVKLFEAVYKDSESFFVAVENKKGKDIGFNIIKFTDGFLKANSVAQKICKNFVKAREDFENLGQGDYEERLKRYEENILELLQ